MNHEKRTGPPNWMRLTEVGEMLGVSHATVRRIHEEIGRPGERRVEGRGRAVEVNTHCWLRAWRWYHAMNDR